MRRTHLLKTGQALAAIMLMALSSGCGGQIEGQQGHAADPVQQTAGSTRTRFYLHYDAQGTPIAATKASGVIACREEFRPYGDLERTVGTCAPLKYTGMVFDEETGLYYYNARYYDPKIGRFLSPDSVRGTIGQPQSHNRYAYVQNNPYRYVDPTGNEPVGLTDYQAAALAWAKADPWASGQAEPVIVTDMLIGAGVEKLVAGVLSALAKKASSVVAPVAERVPTVVRQADKADRRRDSIDREALVDMAKQDKKGRGITEGDMQAYKDLNKELPDPFPTDKVRGPERHLKRKNKGWHGHVGPVDHIPVKGMPE